MKVVNETTQDIKSNKVKKNAIKDKKRQCY